MPTTLHVRARAFIQRATEITKTFGGRAALTKLEHQLVNRVVPYSVLVGQTAVERDIDPTFFDAGTFTARWATDREALASCDDAELGGESSREFVRGALAKGDRCFALFDGDKIASLGWYSRQPTQFDDEHVLRFDPAWVYMYKGYTPRAYRGERLHAIGMSLALRAVTREGSRGLIGYVKATNFASLRSGFRMGWRKFGDLYFVRLLGKTHTWETPGCTPYQFRAERASVAACRSSWSATPTPSTRR